MSYEDLLIEFSTALATNRELRLSIVFKIVHETFSSLPNTFVYPSTQHHIMPNRTGTSY